MGAAENLATHKEWTAAEDRQDLTRHHQFVHDDIVVNQPGAEPVVGLDAYITMMEATYGACPTSTSHSKISSRPMNASSVDGA